MKNWPVQDVLKNMWTQCYFYKDKTTSRRKYNGYIFKNENSVY